MQKRSLQRALSRVRRVLANPPRTLREAIPVFLRHGSPRFLTVCLVIALGVRIFVGGWSAWDVAPLAGLLLYWPIQEWRIHVFILHARPKRIFGHTIDFRVPRKHRAHHREPWRLELVFIPLHSFVYSLPLPMLGGDRLLRTAPAVAAVPTSPTARTLEHSGRDVA